MFSEDLEFQLYQDRLIAFNKKCWFCKTIQPSNCYPEWDSKTVVCQDCWKRYDPSSCFVSPLLQKAMMGSKKSI